MPYDRDSDTRPPLPGAGYAEDYTTPFLVIACMLCFMAPCAVWVMAGLPAVLVLAFLTDRLFLQG